MITEKDKHEIDEAITALERHNEGMQNKMNQPLPHQVEIDQREEIKEQLKKSLEMIPASFGRRDDPSIKVPGKIAWCRCENSNFVVFQLDHQDHPSPSMFTLWHQLLPSGKV